MVTIIYGANSKELRAYIEGAAFHMTHICNSYMVLNNIDGTDCRGEPSVLLRKGRENHNLLA